MTLQTLFQLAGRDVQTPALSDAVVILIDHQNEYMDGPLALSGAQDAVGQAARLLAAARRAGSRIVHIVHRGQAGGLFDRSQWRGAIIDDLSPIDGEAVVEKIRPNGFSETALRHHTGLPGTKIIVAGFMTHNCVSSTVRAALDLGYDITLAADACATRDLPTADAFVSAADLQCAELAALADRHACIAQVAALTQTRPDPH